MFSVCLLLLQATGCSKDADIYSKCRKSDIDGLSKLLAEYPDLLDCQKDSQKWTPLHWSIYSSQKEATKYLVSKGANVNLCTAGGETPMHFAAFKRDVETVQLLFEAGADVNVKANTPGKETPLDMAILAGENLALDRSRPPESIKNYDPKTPEKLRGEEERLRKLFELLKAHGAKRAADIASEQPLEQGKGGRDWTLDK